LGCHGGLRLLALAAQIARGSPQVRARARACARVRNNSRNAFRNRSRRPQARVLVVYGDCMSSLAAFLPTPLAADDLRSVAVFGDGAAGAAAKRRDAAVRARMIH
jgi:predicted naringenin-chalcone synthase